MNHRPFSNADQLALLRDPRTRLIAFDEIYRRYNRTLYVTAYKLVQNHQAAEDLVHAVFEKFLQLRTYDSIENIEAYLRQMCKTTVVDLRRKGSFRSFVSTEYVEGLVAEEDKFHRFNSIHEMLTYCKSLPAQQRRALQLVYLEGQDLKTAAQQMQIALPTIKMHVARAKQFIRKTFFR